MNLENDAYVIARIENLRSRNALLADLLVDLSEVIDNLNENTPELDEKPFPPKLVARIHAAIQTERAHSR